MRGESGTRASRVSRPDRTNFEICEWKLQFSAPEPAKSKVEEECVYLHLL